MEELDTLLTKMLAQEETLQFETFNAATALEMGLRIIGVARAIGRPVALEIHAYGRQLFQHSMDGCTADHAFWLERKRRVVQRYARSSLYMGQCYVRRGTTFEAHTGLDPHEYAAKGGGFPLRVRACGHIGSIVVSGLSEQEDHALVTGVLEDMIAAPSDPCQESGIGRVTAEFRRLAALERGL